MHPAQGVAFQIGRSQRNIRLCLGRVLADHVAVFANIQGNHALIECSPGDPIRIALHVDAQLLQDRSGVGHDPFAVDLVFIDHAVGHGARGEHAARRIAQMAVLSVTPGAGDEMRGVETVILVPLPDAWVAMPRRSGKETSR